jgi:hypothetical protein
VESDESKFYSAKYHQGRMLERENNVGWVFGLMEMERAQGEVRFFEVDRRDSATLLPIIAEHVQLGAFIVRRLGSLWRNSQHATTIRP